MTYRLAKSLDKLRSQINAAFPNRDKSSDGWIGDTKHASRKSDHNPWVKDKNGVGVVTALDTDEDLAPDVHSIEAIVSAIRASRDPRVKYIIYEGRITVAGSNLQQWKKYTGPNPHNHHFHISVNSDPKLYDSTAEWAIGNAATPTPADTPPPPATVRDLKIGDEGEDVGRLQAALKIKVDRIFGRGTRAAVIAFQSNAGLRADGIVGAKTRHELDL